MRRCFKLTSRGRMRLFSLILFRWMSGRRAVERPVSSHKRPPVINEPLEDDPTLRKDWIEINQCIQQEIRSDQHRG